LEPPIIIALSTLYRTITTRSLIPVTTPLATPVFGDVAASLYIIPQGQNSIPQIQ